MNEAMANKAKLEAKRLLKLFANNGGSLRADALHQTQEIVAALKGYPSWKALVSSKSRAQGDEGPDPASADEAYAPPPFAELTLDEFNSPDFGAYCQRIADEMEQSFLAEFIPACTQPDAGTPLYTIAGRPVHLSLLGPSAKYASPCSFVLGRPGSGKTLFIANELMKPPAYASKGNSKTIVFTVGCAAPFDSALKACHAPGRVGLFSSDKAGRFLPYNPFETPLGMREPSPGHLEQIAELLYMCIHFDDETAAACSPDPAAMSFCKDWALSAYRAFSGTDACAYDPAEDHCIAQALAEIAPKIPPRAWLDAADELAEAGRLDLAAKAHARAAPTLADFAAILPDLSERHAHTLLAPGKPIVPAARKGAKAALAALPDLACPTRASLDAYDALVFDLDEPLSNLCERNNALAVKFLWARLAAARCAGAIGPFAADACQENSYPRDLRRWREAAVLAYRREHSRRHALAKSRFVHFVYDEAHRLTRFDVLRRRLESDCIQSDQGRRTTVCSQDEAFWLGTEKKSLFNLFLLDALSARADPPSAGLADAELFAARKLICGPRQNGSRFFALIRTANGRFCAMPQLRAEPKDIWLFASCAEDAALRERFFLKHGQPKALELLAAAFPGGSCRILFEREAAKLGAPGFHLMDKSERAAALDAAEAQAEQALRENGLLP